MKSKHQPSRANARDREPTEPTERAPAPPARDPVAAALDRERVRRAFFGGAREPTRVGRFVLLQPIGSGGMGEVFAGYDNTLDRKVAIKLVRAARGSDRRFATATPPDARGSEQSDAVELDPSQQRLLREAQTLARLSHPNVVQVYEAGLYEGRVYIAMEYIDGPSLRALVRELPGGRGRQRRRAQEEVLGHYVAVGRGLEAAHRAGLVHRDFKPDNVLIGPDGRPRVLDFGLARPLVAALDDGDTWPLDEPDADSAAETADQRAAAALASQAALVRTATGQVLGTPSYMSPEQMRGERADRRSDQFSFCVALYEALYGQQPFPNRDFAGRLDAIEQGEIAAVPAAARAPGPVHQALARGLSADPEARFPDLGSLLESLSLGLKRHRRRRFGLAVALLAALCAVGVYAALPAPVDPCAAGDAAMDTSWNPTIRAATREALFATGAPHAAIAWRSVADHLDAYASEWKHTRRDACEATHERREQSPALFDRQTLCFDHGLDAVQALLAGLAEADLEAVDGAVAAAEALPALASCRDHRALLYGQDPPGTDQLSEVSAIRARLRRAVTLQLLGDSSTATEIARAALRDAEASGYEPVQAEALHQLGRSLVHHGDSADVTAGEAMLREADELAVGARHDQLLAEIWNDLTLSGYRHAVANEDAMERSRRAFGVTKRLGDPPHLRAEALRHRGLIHYRARAYADAERDQRAGLALVVPAHGFTRGLHLHDLGNTVRRIAGRDRARADETSDLYRQASAAFDAAVGPGHPRALAVRYDRAMLALERGQLERARAKLDEIVTQLARTPEADAARRVLAGKAHLGLVEVLRQWGEVEAARAHLAAGLEHYRAGYDPSVGQGGGQLDELGAVAPSPSASAALIEVYMQAGALAYGYGDYSAAIAAYDEAIAIAERSERDVDALIARANRAEAKLGLGAYGDALAAIEQVAAVLGPDGVSVPGLAPFVDGIQGRALHGLGRMSEAAVVLERARAGFASVSDGYAALERAEIDWALVKTRDALGQIDDDTRALARAAEAVFRRLGQRRTRPDKLADAGPGDVAPGELTSPPMSDATSAPAGEPRDPEPVPVSPVARTADAIARWLAAHPSAPAR